MHIEYDPPTDILTIDGKRYHADLFRSFALGPSGPDEVLKLIKRKDDVVAIQLVHNAELSRRFDEIAKNPYAQENR